MISIFLIAVLLTRAFVLGKKSIFNILNNYIKKMHFISMVTIDGHVFNPFKSNLQSGLTWKSLEISVQSTLLDKRLKRLILIDLLSKELSKELITTSTEKNANIKSPLPFSLKKRHFYVYKYIYVHCTLGCHTKIENSVIGGK